MYNKTTLKGEEFMKCAKCLLGKFKNGRFWMGIILLLVIAVLFPLLTIRLITPINNPPQRLNGICTFLSSIKESSDWIGFWGNYFGGVSGGIITVKVFFWTIKDSEKTRKEEKRLQVMPVFDYVVVGKTFITYEKDLLCNGVTTDREKDTYSYRLNISLQICNIGLGPAQKVFLKSCKYGTIEQTHKMIGTIPKGSNRIIQENFKFLNNDSINGYPKTIHLDFGFKDMFGNEYEQQFDMDIQRIIVEKGEWWDIIIINDEPANLINTYDAKK